MEDYQHRLAKDLLLLSTLGCGDTKLYSLLNTQFKIDYIGIKPNALFVDVAEKRYQSQSNFKIIHDTAENQLDKIADADIFIALETLEHIVVRIVEQIAKNNQSYLFAQYLQK